MGQLYPSTLYEMTSNYGIRVEVGNTCCKQTRRPVGLAWFPGEGHFECPGLGDMFDGLAI